LLGTRAALDPAGGKGKNTYIAPQAATAAAVALYVTGYGWREDTG